MARLAIDIRIDRIVARYPLTHIERRYHMQQLLMRRAWTRLVAYGRRITEMYDVNTYTAILFKSEEALAKVVMSDNSDDMRAAMTQCVSYTFTREGNQMLISDHYPHGQPSLPVEDRPWLAHRIHRLWCEYRHQEHMYGLYFGLLLQAVKRVVLSSRYLYDPPLFRVIVNNREYVFRQRDRYHELQLISEPSTPIHTFNL